MFRSLNQIVRNVLGSQSVRTASLQAGDAVTRAANVTATSMTTSFEALETRQHLTATTLTMTVQQTEYGPTLIVGGSNRSDKISITQSSRGITIADSTGSSLVTKRVKMIQVLGGRGNDRITLSGSVKLGSIIDGGAGDDVIRGGYGRDTVLAGAGNDRIYGNAGNDVLAGMAGNDSIYGNAGKDLLVGGAGDDDLIAIGGGGNDSLQGDAGFDSYWMDDALNERVLDTLSYDEQYSWAVHRVDSFMDFVKTDGRFTPTPSELSGQNLPDPELAWDDDNYYTADAYDNFYGLPLFATDGPSIDDVNQGGLGTCYFLSTIGAVAMDNPDWIRQSIVDFGDGTFGVRFIGDNFSEQFVRIDGDLPVNTTSTGGVTLAYASLGQEASIWVPLMEKAWTFARADENREGVLNTSYGAIEGGWLDEVFNATGAADVWKNDPNENPFYDGDDLLSWIENELGNGNTLTYATNSTPTSSSGLVGSHAYTVIDVIHADNGETYLKLRNPWGTDGDTTKDGVDDGYVYVAANDAFRSFVQVGVGTQ